MKLRNKKTGEIVDLSVGYITDTHYGEFIQIKLVACLEDKRSYLFDTFAKFCEDWEDYKPAEPLIKDEKIRKAVRAWAEANGAWLLVVVSSYRIEISQVDAEILFNDPVFKELPRDRQLTITELCGEEEE